MVTMEHSSYLGTIINYMEAGPKCFDRAKGIYSGAKIEFETIKQRIHLTNANKLGPIDEFLNCFVTNQKLIAFNKVSGARIAFENWIVPFIKEDKRKETTQHDRNAPIPENPISQQEGKHKQKQNETRRQDNGPPSMQPVYSRNDQHYQTPTSQKTSQVFDKNTSVSEHASRSLRANNPNIADLSDTNRPTKVAERFSELYDNEWTDAFEELIKNKKSNDEKRVIEVLFNLVQIAYDSSKTESEAQIDDMNACAIHIVKYGKITNHKEENVAAVKVDINLLVQYRKEIASLAVERLKQEFLNRDVKQYGQKTRTFASKCIELTWWMCVQDPPIYMEARTDDHLHSPDMYKAYTQSGSKLDFVVWPALLLHKGGAVLSKGVAQFRK